MNLTHLRYFTVLAHTQHYTRAAEQLCITQPSLSHAIAQLEAELNVPLFEKSGRNTTLTDFGRQFLCCCENILTTLDENVEALQRAARGEGLIRLGLIRPLGIDYIPELSHAFLDAHPGMDIRFSFHTGNTESLLDGLNTHRYDLIFCSEPGHITSGLTSSVIMKQRLMLIVPNRHPLASCASIDLRQTLSYPYIYFSRGSGLRTLADVLFAQINASPRIAYEVEEDQVAAGLVAQNFGIAILPEANWLNAMNVASVPIHHPIQERKICMISQEHFYIPPVVQSFRQFVLQAGT